MVTPAQCRGSWCHALSAIHQDVCHGPVVDPEIVREVSVAGNMPSQAVTAFVKARQEFDWKGAPE
jgi:LysR family hydrogen peroxide-inducible transcriptional activator